MGKLSFYAYLIHNSVIKILIGNMRELLVLSDLSMVKNTLNKNIKKFNFLLFLGNFLFKNFINDLRLKLFLAYFC
jgi:hypothetical protein